MRLKIFLFLLTILSLSSSLTIAVTDFSPNEDTDFPQNLIAISQFNTQQIAAYISQKGQSDDTEKTKKLVSFANLLTGDTSNILGEATISAQIATISASSTPPSADTGKKSYTIAVLGDSMVDTLGPGIPHLTKALKNRYPGKTFTILNYGAGATNIESGLVRLTNGYNYLGEDKPALLSQNPDIVVVESFAYNHWENNQSDLDRHWLTLAKIVDKIRAHNPEIRIVLAAAVAPYCPTYTDGSANLPPERKQAQCETVKTYLQNLVNFATSQGYFLADAYRASLKGSDGNPNYINQGDHIHPSDAGKQLFASKVAGILSRIID